MEKTNKGITASLSNDYIHNKVQASITYTSQTLGMDKWLRPTLYEGCDYLTMTNDKWRTANAASSSNTVAAHRTMRTLQFDKRTVLEKHMFVWMGFEVYR